MTHGSLFSGIGGFDLAAEWMGWKNIFHCEINPFGQRVLHHYWPNAIQYTDITKTDFTKHYGTIEIISGGFPCQPYSHAGQRKGKQDERHLWPQMCRAIKEIAPRFVVGENVRGLTNWNGGLVFDEVCTDLENLGYQVAPFLIPASGVNAPHKRERIWFVAYAKSGRRRKQPQANSEWENRRFDYDDEIRNVADTDITSAKHEIQAGWNLSSSESCNSNATDTNRDGCDECNYEYEEQSNKRGIDAFSNTEQCSAIRNAYQQTNWREFPTESAICSGDDGIPRELDGITFSKWRRQSIMAYGNAIVPNVAFEIFKAIQAYETTYNR